MARGHLTNNEPTAQGTKIAMIAKLAKAFLGMFFVVFANFAIIVNRAVSPCIRTKY
jgi:hypothetical protein